MGINIDEKNVYTSSMIYILGGIQLGYTTILTLSGVSKKEVLKEFAFKPDMVINSLAELDLKTALELQ